jgi:hypothetical protein
VSLGTFDLTAGDAGMVRLGDSSATGGQELVFDAVRWSYRGPSTGVAREPVEAPSGFALMRNYPNPFNSSTSIMYQVSGVRLQESVAGSQSSVASWVKLGVYDILGREVAVLVNRQMRAGTYTEHFDAQALTSGTYIVRLTAGSIIQTLQVILLK